MIDSVYATVNSVMNKQKYGSISPMDFNLFAKQSQLDIFKGYFNDYNNQSIKETLHQSGTEYADLKNIKEADIEVFYTTRMLTLISGNEYALPSLAVTHDEWYKIDKVLCSLVGVYKAEAEKITQSRITSLIASIYTTPSIMFPAYTLQGNTLKVYPTLAVELHYIRLPKAPKWTFVTLTGGTPVFDATASDYQDFELASSEEPLLVVKILQYAGIEIRETEIFQFAKAEQNEKQQKT